MVVIIASSQHDAAVHLDAYGEGIKNAMRVFLQVDMFQGL